ncbi:MAG: HAMP domain-containing histidine kinase, partial [Candidatus Riflebacteria bacterium]|nr:HAMP domain-containing histidine kinase [Candidatus Riflebacteria bacterium]
GFDIVIDYFGRIIETASPFSNICIGKNCLTRFEIAYDSDKKELSFDLKSDEFDERVQSIVASNESTKNLNIHEQRITYDINKLLDKSPEFEEEDLNNALTGVGDFVANFYFNNLYTKPDAELNMYKRLDSLPSFNEKGFEIGVVLYRNAFCIAGYDGTDDWLGFGKRSRSSPAAPSHPTGMWRVRENQICGEVFIDRRTNSHIEEMQNRQGINEDVFFRLFKAIILEGIKAFELYRQSIIRAIRKIQKPVDEEYKKGIDSFIKKPHSVLSMTHAQVTKLAESVAAERNDHAKREKMLSEEIVNVKYDVRLLNTLSTIGLKSSWIAHDLNNEKRSMLSAPGYIVDALKHYGYWEALNDKEHTFLETQNVPSMLNKISINNQKVANFIDITLENVEKRKFDVKENQPSQIIDDLCKKWKKDCSWIDFNVSSDETPFVVSEDVIETILNNLILNTIQQNNSGFSTINKLKIDIDCSVEGSLLQIKYKDYGKGLDSKYIDEPRKILEPHETTRRNGHGLGMWIVNNTVESSGGSILDIFGEKGFYIRMTVGKVYDGKR